MFSELCLDPSESDTSDVVKCLKEFSFLFIHSIGTFFSYLNGLDERMNSLLSIISEIWNPGCDRLSKVFTMTFKEIENFKTLGMLTIQTFPMKNFLWYIHQVSLDETFHGLDFLHLISKMCFLSEPDNVLTFRVISLNFYFISNHAFLKVIRYNNGYCHTWCIIWKYVNVFLEYQPDSFRFPVVFYYVIMSRLA